MFKRIHQIEPLLARQCIHYAKEALVKSREYELYASYIPDAQAEFERIRWFWKDGKKRAASGDNAKQLRQAADKRLAQQVGQLTEVLAGAGRKAEAENIRAQAAALVEEDPAQKKP